MTHLEELWQLDNRPTEWLAVFLTIHGYVPSATVPGDVYFAPPRIHNKIVPDVLDGVMMREQVKMCPECGREFPITAEFWHRNKQGRGGLHSICKECRKKTK